MAFIYPQSFNKESCIAVQNADIAIGSGGVDNIIIPTTDSHNFTLSAVIIPQSDLGTTKNIRGLQWMITAAPVSQVTRTNVTVIIGHTSQSEFGSISSGDPFIDVNGTNRTEVLSSGSFVIPTGGSDGDYLEPFSFIRNFCYNGTDNIIIQVEDKQGSNGSVGMRWKGANNTSALNKAVSGTFVGGWLEGGGVTRSTWRNNIKVLY